VKAGSLGHGTAVPGEFDLDLVIYSQGEFSHFDPSQIDSEHMHGVSVIDINLPKAWSKSTNHSLLDGTRLP